MTKKEKQHLRKSELIALPENQMTEETLALMKSFEKMSWEVYKELVNTKQIIQSLKLKTPKSIYYNEADNLFLYFNPILRKLFVCGKFAE